MLFRVEVTVSLSEESVDKTIMDKEKAYFFPTDKLYVNNSTKTDILTCVNIMSLQ